MQARNAVMGKIHEVLVYFISQSLERDVRDAEGEFRGQIDKCVSVPVRRSMCS